MTLHYVVITPVRDEEAYLEKTIASVVSQSIIPREWIIVDDGSTDRTGQIADQAAKAHPWIKAMHRDNRGFRKAGGGVIEAFYEGYDSILATDWQFMVKLDGDLSFVIEKNTVSHAQSLRSFEAAEVAEEGQECLTRMLPSRMLRYRYRYRRKGATTGEFLFNVSA